jgi:hypothetical protein
MLNMPASSPASQLPQFLWCTCYLRTTQSPCRSWLASDDGVSGDIDVGCAGLIAGKPAPTVFAVNLAFANNPIPCRSWLASDAGVSGAIDVEYAGLIASKPAPTVFVVNLAFADDPIPL